MTTDSLDSHDIYTTVRTSWATRLTQPTEYGIADALGQDTTRQVLNRPAFAAVYLQAATVGVCDAILSRGHDHARTVIHQPRPPNPPWTTSTSPPRSPPSTNGSSTASPGTTNKPKPPSATPSPPPTEPPKPWPRSTPTSPSCAASADSPQHPKNPARTATEPRRHALRERGPVLHRSELEGTPRTPGGPESRRRLANRVVAD